ncbi:hypothetical protein [Tsukamurella tyrosinosolvens]|uniref:hypothetical protein n=1 Tax=Tsukamurella tyrosinosolvens TaxID=57704 RepID=UPI002DD44322|nr:hypothetical protein [Tsukamurella tyrosinosolvens]MEC4616285.1 hypothetical protein [Tsukamurella tyrosinosolvens]
MTAPNAAVGALPGWRRTDPDGGTWLRRFPDAESEWFEFTTNGHLVLRTQEEAEAAGLVAVVAETEVGELTRERDRLHARIDTLLGIAEGDDLIYSPRELQRARLQFSGFAYDNLQAEIERLRAAVPAPLDPGNPEHLRQHADNHQRFCAALLKMPHEVAETARTVAPWDFRREADRLDREQREAEQDAAEEAFVQGIYERWCASDGTDHDLIREAIRAERARQEAGQ